MVFRALVWYAGWLGHTVEWVCGVVTGWGVGREYYRVIRVLVGYDMVFRALVWNAGWLGHTVE